MIIKNLITQPNSRDLLDCEVSKPKTSPDADIIDVLTIMNESGIDCLPVFENGIFLGMIKLIDITQQLAATVKKQKLEYHKVIHDLRNPISNIIGLLNLLEEAADDNHEIVRFCEASCGHALDILDDLIYLAGEENRPTIKELTDLNEFYDNCVNQQKGLFLKKGINFETDFSNQPYKKTIDRKQLRRAIENLLSNAIKFSYPNSVVKISTKQEENKLTLKIIDAGVGIPQHIQSEIFNDFTTARRPGTSGEPSTGLGLSLTKRYIENQGGKIYFTSLEGKGSKFYVVF